MTASATLLTNDLSMPPFDIMRTAYCELGVRDLEASRRFYVDLLDLQVTVETDTSIYLRGWEETAHHSIVLTKSEQAGLIRASFRVRSEADLDALAGELEKQGLTFSWAEGVHPGIGRVLRFRDPQGYPLECFHQLSRVESNMRRFDVQRGAPIMRFDHFNFQSNRVESAIDWWRSMGFRCTEYIATESEPERITGAWLARKPTVHDVALTVGRGPRLHHIGLWVADPNGIIRACDQLAAAERSAAIERGPGRHGVSNAFFVYLRDPDGHRVELYTCDYYTGDPDIQPYRWSVDDPRCRSFWGSQAPDSWYDESSVLLTDEGTAVETEPADVDERTARSTVAA